MPCTTEFIMKHNTIRIDLRSKQSSWENEMH